MSVQQVIALIITLCLSVAPTIANDRISSAVIAVGTTGVIHHGYTSWYTGTDLTDVGADYQHGASRSSAMSQIGALAYKTTAEVGYKSVTADTTLASNAPVIVEDRAFFTNTERATDWYLHSCDPTTDPTCPTTRYENSITSISGLFDGETGYQSATSVYGDIAAISAEIEANGSAFVIGREDTIAQYGYNTEEPVFNEEYRQISQDILFTNLSGDIRAQLNYIFESPK